MKQLQILLPPVHLLLSLLLMGVLDYYLPLLTLLPPYNYAGIAILLSGLGLIILCAVMFKHADTPIIPFEPSTVLLTHGVYRYTRNPIYLGMLIILLGAAVTLGSLSPFLVLPVFFYIIQEGYIRYEETFLEDIFGDRYRLYKSRVRRWL
jgi:protein-S-isoprenylcysteine O-methyltransferase Ste14